ncbi:MAG: carbohydrate ABC transporter permease [Desulfobacterales bacterium]|nr:MAG: carbohydrate ABC transporter permease [Desulfobacterales bacterium]
MRAKRWQRIALFLILLVLALIVALPLYWAVTIALRPGADMFTRNIAPSSLTFQNFYDLIFDRDWAGFQGVSFGVPLKNSLLVAVSATGFSIIVSTFAGYALAMFSFRGRELVSSYILLAYIFPPFIIVVSLFRFINLVGLKDSLLGVALLHLVIVVPYCSWMLRGYFLSIPKSLEESAMIDGCTRMGALLRVILPVSAPGVASAAIFSFTLSWQEMLFSLITLESHDKFTLPIALLAMVMGDLVQWGKLMAGALISIAPPAILYLALQRWIVGGLTAGSVKR